MKKNIVAMLCIACMLPALVCTAFANEGYAVHPRQALPENIINLLTGDSSIVLLDCDPTSGNVQYVSWVSYDYLSELSTSWKTAGVIVYNSTMQAYFIRVSFIPTVSTSGTYEYCSLGTTNGYVLGATKENDSDIDRVSVSINEGLWLTRRHVINIENRCNDFYVQLDYICDRLDELKTSLEKLTTTNSLLNQMIRQLDHIDDALNDDTFPLLSALSSIDQRLVEVRNAIGNVTLNVDSLESLTIDAYDDTYLMDILNAALIYWENTDLGIQSLSNALYDTAASPLYVKLKSLQNRLDDIYLSIQVVQGYLYHTQNPSVISYLKKMSEALTQLQASGSEVPSTLYDIIANRISVNVTSMATSVSNIAKNVAVLTTTIGYGGQQGQTLFVYVTDINAKLGKIYTKFSDLSVSTAYDDTNVIAAVNSVETALSNLSLDVGDIAVVPTDLTPVITSIDAVGVNIEGLNANFNTSLGSLVDKLDVIVDKSLESVENLTVEISVDNDAHNVFYVTDEDGNEESLVDFSGDVLKAGGKLLNFLFKVCFDGAIDNLDGSIDDMDSFYFDGAELGGSLWE